MSSNVTPVASYRGEDSVQRRTWNLAMSFQEVFTAIVRLRYGKQNVPDANLFRNHVKEALRVADGDARARGYSPEDVQQAVFAVVAFLDESVLNCRNPVFADWPRMPLQEELFGGHVAGEIFFQNLQATLQRMDSYETGDLLELYALCILLGYRGRYGAGGAGELSAIMSAMLDKMRRIRGGAGTTTLSPRWMIPKEGVQIVHSDPWVKRLLFAAVGTVVLAIVLFAGYKAGLHFGVSDFRSLVSQVRS